MLDLKPVITVDKEGKAALFSKSFTAKGSANKALKSIKKHLKAREVWEYTITHANNPELASWYAKEIEQITGKQPVFIDNASPALIANTGPGVVCVSMMFE